MKIQHFLIVCVVIASAFADADFDEWKKKNNKSYQKSGKDEKQAEKNYHENEKRVKANNADPNRTYEAGITSQSDKSDEDIAKESGYQYDPNIGKKVKSVRKHEVKATFEKYRQQAKATTKKATTKAAAKATTKKATTKKATTTRKTTTTTPPPEEEGGDECPANIEFPLASIIEQGSCGSCWAACAVTQMEIYQALVEGLDKPLEHSVQDILDCTRPDMGCSGGHPAYALDRYTKEGNVARKDYAYSGAQGSCKHTQYKKIFFPNDKKACWADLKGDHETMKMIVCYAGPMSVGIDATGLQNYRSGIFSSRQCSSDPKRGNHAVVVVGYGETEEGKQYWIVQNSWGARWGMKGYFWIERGVNMCGIENFVFTLC